MKLTPEIIIYEGGEARVEVCLDRETVWLTQEQMSVLFGRERSVGQIPTRHALPPVGDARAARPSHHRLHPERTTAGRARSDRGATGQRLAGAHAHPPLTRWSATKGRLCSTWCNATPVPGGCCWRMTNNGGFDDPSDPQPAGG